MRDTDGADGEWEPPAHFGSSSRSQNGSAAGAGPSSPSSSTSAPSYAAFIPSLARLGPSAPPPPSIAERLAQSRAEGRRRAYNEAQRQQQRQQDRDEHEQQPLLSPSLATTSSASSRAGTTYLGATALAAQEAQRRSEVLQEKRRIAGPISPRSWRAPDANGSARGRPPHMLDAVGGPSKAQGKGKGKSADEIGLALTQAARWRLCHAVRQFMDADELLDDIASSEEHAGGSSTPKPRLETLADYALAQWVETLNDGSTQAAADGYDYMRFDLRLVPPHLKARLLALAGRLAACQPLKGSTLALLFLDDKGRDEEDREVEPNGDVPETWEDDDNDQPTRPTEGPSQASPDHAAVPASLDLSFANCKVSQLRSALFGHLPQPLSGAPRINITLRQLSLAGWDQQQLASGNARKATQGILSSAALLGVLEALPNLATLSLAGAVLGGPQGPNVAHIGQTDVSKGLSDAAVFLRRLSRAAPRLQTLDLSFATGLDGDAIAAVGWDAANGSRGAWPELKHIVLHGIPAFMSEEQIKASLAAATPDKAAPTQQPLAPSRAYAAAWHAAHHGIPQATSSPYLLDHRPGLGRACFPHLGSAGASEMAGAAPVTRGGPGSIAARRREAQAREASSLPWSWVDGGDASASGAESSSGEDRWMRALRAVSADLGPERGIRTLATPPGGEARMARCPISAAWVERWELERAKVLDAVQARWGSAAMRGRAREADAASGKDGAARPGGRKGCLVYF